MENGGRPMRICAKRRDIWRFDLEIRAHEVGAIAMRFSKTAGNRRYRIAVISSVPPDPNRIAGALILHRWLEHPQIDWIYIEPRDPSIGLICRGLDRLTRTRLHRSARQLKHWYEVNRLGVYLRHAAFLRKCLKELDKRKPEIILSVAHGPFYKIAHQASKRTKIPLILLAQDWWPAFPNAGRGQTREAEERTFLRICRESAATIAVSDGMRRELGDPPNTVVIHDLPSEFKKAHEPLPKSSAHEMRIIYAGNISTYGPMVEQAARQCMKSNLLRLEIFGCKPIRWSEGTVEEFREAEIYRGFVFPDEFLKTANNYDLVLAIMSFDPQMRLRMRTCFLSKIVELAQLGKPLAIWGPQDCSAVVWARKSRAALCITNESPEALREALEKFATDLHERRRLASAIQASAANEFNPLHIRRRFFEVLEKVSRKDRF